MTTIAKQPTPARWSLGVTDITFGDRPLEEVAAAAAGLGFEHLDLVIHSEDYADQDLALAVGDRMSGAARDGWSFPAPLPGPGAWEAMVAALHRHPTAVVEPWAGSVCDGLDAIRALRAEVPGVRLLVDTGHAAYRDEDPVQLLPWAAHIQLRQAAPGRQQLLAEEGRVDFVAVFEALDRLDYRGRLTIEYFDIPDYGWGLEDPVSYASALAEHLRPLLARFAPA
ncbi:MAG: TIM barrel protein [Actinomycetota bacterium]|nr:TIM barrel protein [Actinomycetota bacterium]